MNGIFPTEQWNEPSVNGYLERELNLVAIVAEYLATQIIQIAQAKFRALGQPADPLYVHYFDALTEIAVKHIIHFLELEHQRLVEQWRAEHPQYQPALDNSFGN